MDLGLHNKVVLVFGASKGIGRATALALAAEGARVGVVARDEEALQSLVEEFGEGFAYIATDCMSEGAAQKAAQELEAQLGDVYGVVHCIGGAVEEREMATASEESKAKSHRFNVGIAQEVNAYLVPKMQAAGAGRVVHVSSISITHGRGDELYIANKQALSDYSEELAAEVAKDGVVVTSVLPGAVEYEGSTWMKRKTEDPRWYNEYLDKYVAANRMGTADEVAGVITFLCGQQASFMAGAAVPVDGLTT